MTQRQIDAPRQIPRCKLGHLPRYMLDMRQASAGGGHFILCQCGATRRHAGFDSALQDWGRLHGIRTPKAPAWEGRQHALFWPEPTAG
jgi:hypothetical protein